MNKKKNRQHDGGYGTIGNKATLFVIESLSKEDEKEYREKLKKDNNKRYEEFLEFEKEYNG